MTITRDTFVGLVNALYPDAELYYAVNGLAIWVSPPYCAEVEELATLNGLKLRTSTCTPTDAVVRVYGFARSPEPSTDNFGRMVQELARDERADRQKRNTGQ